MGDSPALDRTTALSAALTAALGASLFFVSEPAAAKTILPWLGGTPAAWGATLLFFQLVLLAGYWSVGTALRKGGAAAVAVVHVTGLALAAVMVGRLRPFANPPVPSEVTLTGTLWLLGTQLGMPAFALAMTAPAIQTWVTTRSTQSSRASYVYYAASNAGSLAGLLAYPWLIEPRIPLSVQWDLWRRGLGVLAALVLVLWLGSRVRSRPTWALPPAAEPRRRQWLEWIVRAAIPAALLAAVTAYITRDIAPVPMLWVIPLALYIVTWIIAFSPRAGLLVDWADRIQDLCAVVALALFLNPASALIGGVVALITLVVVGLVQHGALARSAPPEIHLGRFYVALALGGAAGTALVVGVVPLLFPIPVEAPLVLAAAVALGRPTTRAWTSKSRIRFLVFGSLAVIAPLILGVTRKHALASISIVAGVAAMLWRSNPRRAAVALVAVAGLDSAVKLSAPDYLGGTHGLLGRLTVQRWGDGNALISGSTWHGFEPRIDSGEPPPAGLYYVRAGAYGDVIRLMAGKEPGWRFGVVGLGVGSLGCTAPPGTSMTYFEINPGVIRLAKDTTLFHSLARCAPTVDLRLGDARLRLAREPSRFDLLTIDAFNSDAIPTHLLTAEAFDLYIKRLAPDGVIALHLSNRYLDLVPVAAALARRSGWVAAETRRSFPADSAPKLKYRGEWITLVAIAADSAALAPLIRSGRWQWTGPGDAAPWTDDWTPLASTLRLTRANILGR